MANSWPCELWPRMQSGRGGAASCCIGVDLRAAGGRHDARHSTQSGQLAHKAQWANAARPRGCQCRVIENFVYLPSRHHFRLLGLPKPNRTKAQQRPGWGLAGRRKRAGRGETARQRGALVVQLASAGRPEGASSGGRRVRAGRLVIRPICRPRAETAGREDAKTPRRADAKTPRGEDGGTKGARSASGGRQDRRADREPAGELAGRVCVGNWRALAITPTGGAHA